MSWQGYWSNIHMTLPRLSSPYTGHPLEGVLNARHALRLSGSADVINSIIPSLQPSNVQGYNRDRKPVQGTTLDTPVRSIPAGTLYLKLSYGRSLLGGSIAKPPGLIDLWYQKQSSAWWLVRTLLVPQR